MRAALPFLLWLFATACCCAQQQEQKLWDRIHVDPSKQPYANSLSKKQFQGGGDLNMNPAAGQSSTFAGAKKFDAGGFETRSFFGIKNPWFGKKVYETGSVDLSKSTMVNADKKFTTKDAGTKEFAQAGKQNSLPDNTVKTSPFVVKGASQGGVDQLKKNLTIDDVREILNKNH